MSEKPAWQTILENQSRQSTDVNDALERVARYAAREQARSDHFISVLGDVVTIVDKNLGKDAEVDEFLNHIKTYLLQSQNEANQVGFKAQRAPASADQ